MSVGAAGPRGTIGRPMRISFSSWATTDSDVERSLAAILAAYRDAGE